MVPVYPSRQAAITAGALAAKAAAAAEPSHLSREQLGRAFTDGGTPGR